jgi:hypothetical protein
MSMDYQMMLLPEVVPNRQKKSSGRTTPKVNGRGFIHKKGNQIILEIK